MTPLRQRMIEDMQVRNLTPHTQRAYLQMYRNSRTTFANHQICWDQPRSTLPANTAAKKFRHSL